jgi:nickel-dependent lactate racemase
MISIKATNDSGLTKEQINQALTESLKGRTLKKVLIVPPDFIRFHSNAGYITNFYYHMLKDVAQVDIIPALGTHVPMTREECEKMFGDIPFEKFIAHNWREDVVTIGTAPEEYLREISEDTYTSAVECQVNKILFDNYDLIISVGQVVPHEVIGMSNHSKNLFVGLGGSKIINASHMVGALYGLERMMGKDHTPTRKLLDYCLERFLNNINILWVLTVTTAPKGEIITHGLFIGEDRRPLEEAIKLAKVKNLDVVEKPIKKCVVYLDPGEFKSTWLGNKAVYRTRMAIADGGELVILAPGVNTFGEDKEIDRLIRKYGYVGREKVIKLFKERDDLKNNMSAAAHLIHGSSDGRFKITYAVDKISQEEIEQVNYSAADYNEMAKKYPVDTLKTGWNIIDGEEIYYIPNPALGLWIEKGRL